MPFPPAGGRQLRAFVTGSAGFIGSNLADRLLDAGHEVVGYDNLSTGQWAFLERARASRRFHFIEGDILDMDSLVQAMAGCELTFHLAANADVRHGTENPRVDFEQNAIGTSNVLEAMRANGVGRIAFASTGSVYGEPKVFPTPEDAPFPLQTSLYGASKVAAEGLIQAYSEGFGIQAYIFRFVSILGERYSHGHVFDFYKQLREHPGRLDVLGNGKQRKSYLYVQDCIEAILLAMERVQDKVNIFNLGAAEYCEVNESISWICEYLHLAPQRAYAGGERGWIGDSPFVFLDCSRIRSLGWRPAMTIREGIVRTVQYLEQNAWVLERM